MSTHKRKDSLFWGVVLIALGVIFILNNLGFDIWDYIARLWPLILIIWGSWKLYFGIKERKKETKESQTDQV